MNSADLAARLLVLVSVSSVLTVTLLIVGGIAMDRMKRVRLADRQMEDLIELRLTMKSRRNHLK